MSGYLNNFNKYKKKFKIHYKLNIKIKKLIFGTKLVSGKNYSGKLILKTRGSRKKRKFKFFDYKRSCLYFWNLVGYVLSIEYDAFRSCYLALIQYSNGYISYIIAPEGLRIGSVLGYGNIGIQLNYLGNRMPLIKMPQQAKLHNISFFARAAGTYIKICGYTTINKQNSIIQIPSGLRCILPSTKLATLGQVSNSKNFLKKKYKAGQNRNLGFKPKVRGVAMNPVDHPHGGGEGKTSGGRNPVSP